MVDTQSNDFDRISWENSGYSLLTLEEFTPAVSSKAQLGYDSIILISLPAPKTMNQNKRAKYILFFFFPLITCNFSNNFVSFLHIKHSTACCSCCWHWSSMSWRAYNQKFIFRSAVRWPLIDVKDICSSCLHSLTKRMLQMWNRTPAINLHTYHSTERQCTLHGAWKVYWKETKESQKPQVCWVILIWTTACGDVEGAVDFFFLQLHTFSNSAECCIRSPADPWVSYHHINVFILGYIINALN